MSAEYILSHGNDQVILCERGIRTFETYTRNTLDISAVPVLKQLTHLPIVIDPSHATGNWDWVDALSRGGRRRGRRWADDRGAPASRTGPLGRRAVACARSALQELIDDVRAVAAGRRPRRCRAHAMEVDPLASAQVAVVGLGLMGGSLAAALSTTPRLPRGGGRGAARRQPGTRRSTLRFIDRGTTDLAEGVAEADIVVLCHAGGRHPGQDRPHRPAGSSPARADGRGQHQARHLRTPWPRCPPTCSPSAATPCAAKSPPA